MVAVEQGRWEWGQQGRSTQAPQQDTAGDAHGVGGTFPDTRPSVSPRAWALSPVLSIHLSPNRYGPRGRDARGSRDAWERGGLHLAVCPVRKKNEGQAASLVCG